MEEENGRLAYIILELFEDLLESKKMEIPCESKEEEDVRHDFGNDAPIYGTEYAELHEEILSIINFWEKGRKE